ncbi:SpoIIE family protein phosphatase [Geodermatophilus sp. SYSU D01062]
MTATESPAATPPSPGPDPLRSRVDDEALARCAEEPIAVPGAIQPHGALLAVTEPDLAVVVASANAADVLGTDPTGRTLADLLTSAQLDRLRAALAADLAEAGPLRVAPAGSELDLVLSRSGDLLVTEWEPVAGAGQAGAAWHRRLPTVLQRLSAPTSLEGLTAVLAREVRALTGFDRVMVYRFDTEWNGEVVAEDRRADLEPFLGLHYPASDIPAQARALYATNWMRLIPDATYTPVPLEPPLVPGTERPLDLSGAMLRSVSPVHLEYLANMGVTASMSVSLIDRGRLWGLISCHGYSGAHRPSYADRTAAEFLGRTASLLLHTTVEAGERDRVVAVAQREAGLVAAIGRTPRTPAAALVDGDLTALDLLPAAGAAVRLDGRLHLLGRTPPADRVAAVVPAVLRAGGATDRLTLALPGFDDLADDASGVLAVEVGGGRGDFLAWFRPETPREVSWGGDPATSKVTDGRLSPRRSFARWTETVRGTARPWHEHEVAAARALATHLGEAVLARAGEDDRLSAALQRTLLLEELPKVPGVALGARYRPSEADVVGGDWYDLVPLPSGRLAVVLGDVAGHGLTAASVTAQLRHALRAALLRDEGPAAALAELNRLVAALLPGEMATAQVVQLDPRSGELALANAGHLPAVHARAGAARLVTDGRGPALGMLDDADYPEVALRLDAGDRLLLYSDGLVERRDRPLPEGMEAVRAAVAGIAGEPQEVVDGVVAALDPAGTDDVTVVGLARV